MDRKELIEYTEEMFRRAGENADSKAGERASEFVEKLYAYPGILEEYIYFLEHGSYLGKACVGHATVIDIMVWQMDHFKAMLDRDRTAYKKNPYKMVL